MKHILLSLLFLLVLTACGATSPVAVDTEDSSSSVLSVDAWNMLHDAAFPEGWKAIPGDCGSRMACFYSPLTYTGANEPIDHDVFYAHPTQPDQCTEEFAKAQSMMDGGKDTSKPFVMFESAIGYTWTGYAGAGAQPGDAPTTRFVCLHHPTTGFDILISSYIADTKTTTYLDTLFIPFWLHLFITE